jgi:hypothetical protein
MSKSKVDGTSDYGILLQKYENLKKDVPMDAIINKLKRLDNVHTQLLKAEDVISKTLDLINSSEVLVNFPGEKRTLRKYLENYNGGRK